MLGRLARMFTRPVIHPIDLEMGIDTSGTLSPKRLRTGQFGTDRSNVGYVGSQPSVIDRALIAIGDDVEDVDFIDVGCGKGRALAVAGGFPFRRVIGIEISPALSAVARSNVAALKRNGLMSAEGVVITGDATAPDLTPGAVVYFYNSFGEELVAKLLAHIEAHIARTGDKIWFVHYNPVKAHLLDASPMFRRHFAERIAFTDQEAEAADFSNDADSVVVWQSLSGKMVPRCPGADRAVKVTIPGLGAEVVTG